jgi:hypothetical protein
MREKILSELSRVKKVFYKMKYLLLLYFVTLILCDVMNFIMRHNYSSTGLHAAVSIVNMISYFVDLVYSIFVLFYFIKEYFKKDIVVRNVPLFLLMNIGAFLIVCLLEPFHECEVIPIFEGFLLVMFLTLNFFAVFPLSHYNLYKRFAVLAAYYKYLISKNFLKIFIVVIMLLGMQALSGALQKYIFKGYIGSIISGFFSILYIYCVSFLSVLFYRHRKSISTIKIIKKNPHDPQ